jgi:hypothetical protein
MGAWRRCRPRRPGGLRRPCRPRRSGGLRKRCRPRRPGGLRRRCRRRRRGGPRGVDIAGNVQQVARRVHRGRGQHLVPARTCAGIGRRLTRAAFGSAAPGPIAILPGGCRGAMPVGRRRPAVGPGLPGPTLTPGRPPSPREGDYQHGHQANSDACRAQGQAKDGDVTSRTSADHVHGRAHDHENQAQQDRSSAHHRQADDEPHPPGGGIRAHWSTIASRFAPRKLYRQARPLR